MLKLDEIPDDVDTVWWGKPWDKEGCLEEFRIYPPESEFCHGCVGSLGVRSSGVATRDTDGRWFYYDPFCWGEFLAESYAEGALEAVEIEIETDGYAGRPNPEHW